MKKKKNKHKIIPKYPKRDKKIIEVEAMSMYLQGVKIKEIAKQLKRHNKTICYWKKKYHWDKAKKNLEKQAIKDAKGKSGHVLIRIVKRIRRLQDEFDKRLDEGMVDINVMSELKSLELEAKVHGLLINKQEISTEPINIKINIPLSVKKLIEEHNKRG